MRTAAVGAVVYALDARNLARFYGDVLGFERAEVDDQFVRLAGPQSELVIVQAPQEWVDSVTITSPPELREDTPIKLFFQVPSLPLARTRITEMGGVLFSEDKEWMTGDFLVVDGCDPEGNVFQLREYVGSYL